MKIKVSLSIGYPTAIRTDVLEVEDYLTDEEIDEEVSEWANNYIDFGWVRLD